MSVKQTESKITALYERLSRDDDQAGDMKLSITLDTLTARILKLSSDSQS